MEAVSCYYIVSSVTSAAFGLLKVVTKVIIQDDWWISLHVLIGWVSKNRLSFQTTTTTYCLFPYHQTFAFDSLPISVAPAVQKSWHHLLGKLLWNYLVFFFNFWCNEICYWLLKSIHSYIPGINCYHIPISSDFDLFLFYVKSSQLYKWDI